MAHQYMNAERPGVPWREVFIIDSQNSPNKPTTFDHNLLVLDEVSGWTFTWGSHHIDHTITKIDKKALHEQQQELEKRETHVGMSQATNAEIRQLMCDYSRKFNLSATNCQEVTEKVAHALVDGRALTQESGDLVEGKNSQTDAGRKRRQYFHGMVNMFSRSTLWESPR